MAIYKNTPPVVLSGSVLNIDAANWAQPVSRNLLNYSTDLTNAAWSKSRCQITASAGIAPDGTNTAFAMTVTNASDDTRLAISSFTASVQGGPWTFSCYVSKSNNCNTGGIQLGIYDGATTVQGVEPNYAIQANFIPSGSGGIATRKTTFEGNGWYRIATTVTLTSSIFTYYTFIDLTTAFGGTLTVGDVVYLWKPQFEAGTEATQPNDIPTTVRFAPDLSGNGNTGSFSSNRPTRTPNNGGSIAFLGSYTGYPTLTYAATPTLNISGSSMSGEVWVKFNRLDYTTSSGSLMYFYRKGTPDSASPHNGMWFSYDNRNNGNGFPYTCFGNTAGGFVGGGNNFADSSYTQTFTTGSWNHIVFVINNSTGSFYINGLQKGPNKNFTNLDLYNTGSSTTGVTAFKVVPPAPTPFEIGVFRLYNRALSPQKVFQNYNALKSRFNLS